MRRVPRLGRLRRRIAAGAGMMVAAGTLLRAAGALVRAAGALMAGLRAGSQRTYNVKDVADTLVEIGLRRVHSGGKRQRRRYRK